MKLRPATAEDAAAIAAIRNHLIRDTLVTFTTNEVTAQDIETEIATRPCFLVAEDGGQVAGYACYGPFRGGPGYARTGEHSVHIAEGAQGRGIGAALMAALEAQAAANGIHVLVAGISSTNPRSEVFHARLGYETVGRMPEVGRKGGKWLGLILMQKILQTAP